ncbi:hypothetical protein T440DRAFT_516241 [Plenodomus tracheiphilus IPT5]|uniref:BZIP domain-containing protein n=1 Tax=Plenodomus tracheiphilus IPT5 TaxID=1408161 RepID=A0A6A7BFH7_9PLEO|nr:hypothetical protein T440DRAFT_516241 [Plenodomus tracheiphilus IPT5]
MSGTPTYKAPIELAWSSRRPELRDESEDWMGMTNPVERRKLQNRLNQRARRKRKDARGVDLDSSRERWPKTESQDTTDSSRSSSSPVVDKDWRCLGSSPQVQRIMLRFAEHARASYLQGTPSLTHLPLLVKLNVSCALQSNATMLGLDAEYNQWDGLSPLSKAGPILGSHFQQEWPQSLRPTDMQYTIPHHPWIDAFPWARLRDNMLQAFEYPAICNEDELCYDVCEFADVDTQPTLVVWGPSHDPRCWEVTVEFLKKWGWLLSGCLEAIDTTNYWRVKRGEKPITIQEVQEAIRLSMPRQLRPSGSSSEDQHTA